MTLHTSSTPAALAATLADSERLRGYLKRLVAREDLAQAEAADLLGLLIDSATDAQIAAVLVALAQKGETGQELAGLAEAMRNRMVKLRSPGRVVDTAGTGASKAKTFNVSTAAAFVIAAAGLPIAKHGARAATSRSGSADVLGALGVKIDVPSELAERCLRELGICFLFAPKYHPAAARVAPIRREIGIRTAFNLIGPLSNPAGAPLQVLGVSHPDLIDKMAGALALLGCEHAWIVCGDDGLDEVSLAAETTVAEVRAGEVTKRKVAPQDFGANRRDCSHLCGGDAACNAKLTLDVLEGRADPAARDLVLLNAAAALHIGLNLDLPGAFAKAREVLESHAAKQRLEDLRAMTNTGSAAAEARG